jgi:SAM-dependent methyltransferase
VSDSRWASSGGGGRGEEYAARFASLAASGREMHGEATLCASLVPPGARVLDAGCGTGRVAIRLAELGYRCVGVDVDVSMLEVARRESPEVHWQLLDLVDIDELDATFDLVVAAGIASLARRLAPGGLLVAGFGLDAAHLPLDDAPFGVAEYDAWCATAGLELIDRFATWSAEPFDGGGYAVSLHRHR